MTHKVQRIAFFDFDGTLTRGDSFMPFMRFVVGAPLFYLKLCILLPLLIGYLLRLIPNDRTKEMVTTFYLKGYDADTLRALGKSYSEQYLPNILRDEGIAALQRHQSQGDITVLVSASFDPYLEPWAKKMGFDHLISSQLEIVNGKISGKIAGKNCYGEEKVTRIVEAIPNYLEYETFAYGDSPGDKFMLDFVDNGYLWTSNQFQKQKNDDN